MHTDKGKRRIILSEVVCIKEINRKGTVSVKSGFASQRGVVSVENLFPSGANAAKMRKAAEILDRLAEKYENNSNICKTVG